MTVSLERRQKLGQLHQLKKQLGLDDETYRDRLMRETGKRSAAELSDGELVKVIAAFHGKQNRNDTKPHHTFVRALWIACWNIAAIDDGSDRALDAFCERQTGKPRLAFVTPVESGAIAEALKAILERAGVHVPANDAGGLVARRNLLVEQWRRWNRLPDGPLAVDQVWRLEAWACKTGGSPNRRSFLQLAPETLDAASRVLGSMIRKHKTALARPLRWTGS